jgi:hypothetical protein
MERRKSNSMKNGAGLPSTSDNLLESPNTDLKSLIGREIFVCLVHTCYA